MNLRQLYAVAACFLIFISLTAYGISYYEETSIISLDVNPSIELNLNRYDKVIGVNALNYEGKKIVEGVNIKHKKYDDAIESLLVNEIYNMYIKDNSNVVFTVSSKDFDKEGYLLASVQNTAGNIINSKSEATNIEYYAVDNQIVEDAHHYGVTAGKYMALLKLQEEIPDINIENYTHCSITEIKTTITNHHNLYNNKDVKQEHDSNIENHDSNGDEGHNSKKNHNSGKSH